MKPTRRTYFLMATDPVHVGTGGTRLGRIDNSIIREPSTRLPKIPGSSLEGVLRNFAAWRLIVEYEKDDKHSADLAKLKRSLGTHPDQKKMSDKEKTKNMLENIDSNSPLYYTFGFSKGSMTAEGGEEGGNMKGTAHIYDATIALFPVYTFLGPVWVTTSEILHDSFGIKLQQAPALEKVFISTDLYRKGFSQGQQRKINLGWLYIDADELKGFNPAENELVKKSDKLNHAFSRLVVVNEALLTHIVNSNLEVRTSVAIEFETGAAKEGALFTYEAIPRATILKFDVEETDHRGGQRNGSWLDLTGPLAVVEMGMEYLEHLGVGGMGTRGFGRMTKLV
ncbi:MAG: type III-B CRISPR module RAMP protein Cmr4 [Nitrososphaerota archaeon]|nr:type III-B CRISPR module RAMP protein Cmr4 [Nitrososphaerota archaeon]